MSDPRRTRSTARATASARPFVHLQAEPCEHVIHRRAQRTCAPLDIASKVDNDVGRDHSRRRRPHLKAVGRCTQQAADCRDQPILGEVRDGASLL